MAFGETGHLPSVPLPFLMAAAGLVGAIPARLLTGGLLAATTQRPGGAAFLVFSAVAGAGVAVAMGLIGLGARPLPAAVAGGGLAVISAFVEERRGSRR